MEPAGREVLRRGGAGGAAQGARRRGRGQLSDARDSRWRAPVRLTEYTLPGGWTVLVGRTESDNDHLSLKLARPDDWWFHVRGMPGSHVVLQGPEGGQAGRATREQAAAIAAWHSKAREGGVVAVSSTRARYVTKPRGAPPGTVQIRKEVLLRVRPALPQP